MVPWQAHISILNLCYTVGKNPVRAETPSYPIGSFGIGVEVEFLLQPRENIKTAHDIRQFSKAVASSYNDFMDRSEPGRHPRMHNAIDESYLGPRFAEWSLDSDSTIEMPKKGHAPCKCSSWSQTIRSNKG